jgi:hypothetical protein
VGNERAEWLGDGDDLGLCVVVLGVGVLGVGVLGVGVLGVGVVGVEVLGVAVLGVLPEIVALGVPLPETVGAAEPVPPGESEGGVADGEPDEQADTDTGASMAKAAQPSTVPRKRRRP